MIRFFARRNLLSDVFKGALLFAILGPVTAAAGIAVILGVTRQDSTAASSFPVIAAFALLFGGIPASITGAIAGWWRKHLHAWQGCALISLVGAVVSFAFCFAADAFLEIELDLTVAALSFGLPGAISAAICAWLFKPRFDMTASAVLPAPHAPQD